MPRKPINDRSCHNIHCTACGQFGKGNIVRQAGHEEIEFSRDFHDRRKKGDSTLAASGFSWYTLHPESQPLGEWIRGKL